MPHGSCGVRRTQVLAIGHVFESALDDGISRIAIAAVGRSTHTMVRQIFFVAVDADEILESAGDSGFFVSLEFRQIDDDVGIDGGTRDEVLMYAAMMCVGHKARVVP